MSRRALLTATGSLGAAALGWTASGCAAGAPSVPERFRLATGPAGAVYREIGQAYAAELDRAWGRSVVEVLHTEAAVENARLLVEGDAEIGLVNVDVAAAYPDDLRALARVFDSVLHVVAPTASQVRTVADLDGRVIAAGLEESGTRFVLNRLLESAGVRATVRTYSQADSVTALLDGEVEAVVSLTGMPTPAVQELAEAALDTRLVDLAVDLRRLNERFPLDYFTVVIPATMYPPMSAVTALAVPTLLVVPTRTADDVAEFCVRILFERAEQLSRVRGEASQINPRTGAATTPIELHPAAREWFRGVKA